MTALLYSIVRGVRGYNLRDEYHQQPNKMSVTDPCKPAFYWYPLFTDGTKFSTAERTNAMKRLLFFLRRIFKEFFAPPEAITVHNRLLTVPNAVTSLGLLLAGLHGWLLLTEQNQNFIPAIFFAAVLTDAADGFLARRLDQHSYAGKILDPVRDRVLGLIVITNVMMTLPVRSIAWLIGLLIALEICVAILHSWSVRRDQPPYVHTVAKIRQACHVTTGTLMLVGIYWIQARETFFPNVQHLMTWYFTLMLAGTCAALVALIRASYFDRSRA